MSVSLMGFARQNAFLPMSVFLSGALYNLVLHCWAVCCNPKPKPFRVRLPYTKATCNNQWKYLDDVAWFRVYERDSLCRDYSCFAGWYSFCTVFDFSNIYVTILYIPISKTSKVQLVYDHMISKLNYLFTYLCSLQIGKNFSVWWMLDRRSIRYYEK